MGAALELARRGASRRVSTQRTIQTFAQRPRGFIRTGHSTVNVDIFFAYLNE
jgi:hypothetical protein